MPSCQPESQKMAYFAHLPTGCIGHQTKDFHFRTPLLAVFMPYPKFNKFWEFNSELLA